jgi:hypothetical protein
MTDHPRVGVCPLEFARFSEGQRTLPSRQSQILLNHNLSPNADQLIRSAQFSRHNKELDMTNLAATNSGRAKSVASSAIAVFVLMMGLVATASAATHSPQRDAAAVSTLQSAVTALGGANAIGSIQDCVLAGSVLYGDGTSKNFNWTIAGSEFRRELDFPNGGMSVFFSGHGSPAWTQNGTTSALHYHVARANLPLYLPPYLLFQELSNSIYTLKYVGVVQLNGKSVVQVHMSDDSDAVGTLVTPQEWYFDPVSFLPLQVQFRQPSNENAADYVNATYAFSQFAPFSGVLVPSTISYSQDNVPNKTITISSVTFNSGVSQNDFNPPQGGGQ